VVKQGRRRRSRLFSGSPELLLVSEDIPGIVMPAPPASLPPLVDDDEPEFDLNAFHAEEDAEEEDISEGPLRLYIGAPDVDGGADPPPPEDDTPIWDVSALAMPEAPEGGEPEFAFLDEDEPVDEDDIVEIGSTPPPLVMSVSVEEAEEMSPPSDWEDTPTMPAAPSPAIIRDEAPPVQGDDDPADLPLRLPFTEGENIVDAFLAMDIPRKVDAIMAMGEEEELGPVEDEWADDDAETEFFSAPTDTGDADDGDPPPTLPSDPPRSSPAFRPIPDKSDPPMVPILGLLVAMVLLAVFSVSECGTQAPPPMGTVDNPVKAQPPTRLLKASTTGSVAATGVGYLTVETNEQATIYVDTVKQGTSPVEGIELAPGNHKIRAVTIETGRRQVVTAHVVAGETRRVVLEFQ
jgi:hypothetical protein